MHTFDENQSKAKYLDKLVLRISRQYHLERKPSSPGEHLTKSQLPGEHWTKSQLPGEHWTKSQLPGEQSKEQR
jgi:hypothetical protein